MQSFITKTIKVTLGLLICGIGTAFMLHVGWGSAPMPTLIEGAAVFFEIDFGRAGVFVNLVFFVLLLLLGRNQIGVGTVLTTVLFGYFVNFGVFLLAPLQIAEMGMILKIFFLLFGTAVAAAGLGYYVAANFGTGAMDAMSIIVHEKTGIDFRYCRWGMDAAMMLTGVLMGGAWGVGTVVSLVLTAPIMQFVIQRVNK